MPQIFSFYSIEIYGFFHRCSKNAIAMAKSGQVASSDLAAIKSGGKSIDELTGMCLGWDKNSLHLKCTWTHFGLKNFTEA